jgi:hypothetical protein
MALSIPQRYLSRINKIRSLSDSAIEELEQALASSSVNSRAKDMAEQITPMVPGIPPADLFPVVDALYALYRVREYSELDRKSFLRELVESIRSNSEPEIPESEVSAITERFKRLLKIETLESISKAITLQRDGERLYCGSRILSDIRPVFGRNDNSEPKAAVITHTLRISYHEDGAHRDMYFVLDEEDLYNLRTVIERAESKSQTLDQVLSTAKIARLGI